MNAAQKSTPKTPAPADEPLSGHLQTGVFEVRELTADAGWAAWQAAVEAQGGKPVAVRDDGGTGGPADHADFADTNLIDASFAATDIAPLE